MTWPPMRWLGAAAMVLLAAGLARAEERTMVTLGTATPGGGFPVYGQAVAETINKIDPSLEVKTRNTKGSTENVPLLLARTLHRGEPALGARLPQARETTAANTVAAAPRPDLIHPGARRYFREIGISP